MSRTWTALAGLLVASACSRPSFDPGEPCLLNTECASHLVCRLGRCREECRITRDCALGLSCIRDEGGFGVCQVPADTDCAQPSDCPESLTCVFGRCTNACERDDDCPPGARCDRDPSGVRGCRDVAETACERNSQCLTSGEYDLVCASDGLCREACRFDEPDRQMRSRDCRDGTVCARTDNPDVAFVCQPLISEDPPMPLPPPTFTPQLGGGSETGAAIRDGVLYGWGSNTDGQLGPARVGDRQVPPQRIGTLSDVNEVAAGQHHTCAVVSGTQVLCWGANEHGQLGRDTSGADDPNPQAVVGLPGVPTQLALGALHSCAIADDALYCWGDNGYRQLGPEAGSSEWTLTPTLVPLPEPPLMIATHRNTVCALIADRSLYCWGQNDYGQVGDGSTTGLPVQSPTRILDRVVQAAVGGHHACAIRRGEATEVLCWGRYDWGQLGDGRSNPEEDLFDPVPARASIPLDHLELSRGPHLALGRLHTCLGNEDAVLCWGANRNGQVGNEISFGPVIIPRLVEGAPAGGVIAGDEHTCVFDSTSADVSCWGRNGSWQLGRMGSDDPVPGPVEFR